MTKIAREVVVSCPPNRILAVLTDVIRIEGRSKSNGRASLTETLTPDVDGCHVRLEVDYDPPLGLIGEIADKLVFERRHEEEAEHVLAGLKALCEVAVAP